MKKIIITFALVLIYSVTFSQWIEIYKATTYLQSIYFTDANTGYIVAQAGYIFKTTDAGTSWVEKSSGTTEDLNSVYFKNSNVGYAVGDNGTILKTTDGGDNWVRYKNAGFFYNSVYFTDIDTGYIVGQNGYMYKTTNGGTTWTMQTSGSNSDLNSVCFTDANTGYIAGGGGLLLKTTNGGTKWTKQTSGTTCCLYSLCFLDSAIGYAVGKYGTILKTTNGGNTWTPQISEMAQMYLDLRSVYFTDSNTGYAVGYDGYIINTTNGGTKWACHRFGNDDMYTRYSVFFTSKDTGYTVGFEHLFKTFNGSTTYIGESTLTKTEINVYPNPCNNELKINLNSLLDNPITIKIFNIQGLLVKSITTNNNENIINISNLSKGIYFVKVVGNNINVYERVIKL